jgi:hypothetical protein
MMSTSIQKLNKAQYGEEEEMISTFKEAEMTTLKSANIKYFFEEKIWSLSVLLHDKKAFNVMSLNGIVKNVLIKRILSNTIS